MDSSKTALNTFSRAPQRRPSFSERVFLRAMKHLKNGAVKMVLPDGEVREFGDPGAALRATVRIRRPEFFQKVVRGGGVGLGESFMAQDWDVDDLPAFLTVLASNYKQLEWLNDGLHFLERLQDRLLHFRRRNHLGNTRKNIAEHYDLSNAFYQTFLDPTLSYSSGLYDESHQTLEEAQANKIRRVLDLSGIQTGQTLLEIGSGWGALALCAAREYGCRVITITLSQEQYTLARERIEAAGLSDRIEVQLLDYRQLNVQADALVSVEMIEAVGHEYFPAYFKTIARCLKPGGRAVLQAITMPDDRYASYCRTTDFINKHIFPGGHLPSPGVIQKNVSRTEGLELVEMTGFGRDYGRTLNAWYQRFVAAGPAVEALGFDETFRRKWAYYLAFCQAGFDTDLLDVQHVVLRASARRA